MELRYAERCYTCKHRAKDIIDGDSVTCCMFDMIVGINQICDKWEERAEMEITCKDCRHRRETGYDKYCCVDFKGVDENTESCGVYNADTKTV